MKCIFHILALIAMTNAYSRSNIPSSFTKPFISAATAQSMVEKQLPVEFKDKMFLIAIEWSSLTCPDVKHPENSFYKQPITGRLLNLGLSGKPDEWSWFITWATSTSGKVAKYEKWEFLSFQIRSDGSVNSVDADN